MNLSETHDKTVSSGSRNESTRFRFTLRRLFLVTGIVSIGLALVIFQSTRTARQRLMDLPRDIEYFRAEYPIGGRPYSIGVVESRRLASWVANTKPEKSRKDLTPAFAIEFFISNRPNCRVEFQTVAGSDSRDQIYFRWENKLRVGSYASVRSIIEQPVELSVPNERYKNFYSDQDRDGVIDTMHQMDGTNSHAIVWEDTNGNGFFDREYFTNHGQILGPASTIDVPIPTNAKID